jgi:hypothetical protein
LIARWPFKGRSITAHAESGQFDDDIDEEVQINSPNTEGNQSMRFDG